MYLSRAREVVESVNRALRIDSKYERKGTYVLALASAYAQLSDLENSRRLYEDAASLHPKNAGPLHGLAGRL